MPNKELFNSANSRRVTKNEAGGLAYELESEHALAQYAFTGTLANTYYISARAQLEKVLDLCMDCSPEFVAKVAVASRQHGYMKDMPAMLAAYLHAFHPELLEKVFDKIIDNGKMLKSFVQIVRSNAVGRRSLGSKTKKLINNWINNRTNVQLMYDNVGKGDVSLEHILRMTHPKPKTAAHAAMFSWICGAKFEEDHLVQKTVFNVSGDRKNPIFEKGVRRWSFDLLPNRLLDWNRYRQNPSSFESPPKVPYQMLEGLDLSTEHWEIIAKHMSWQQLRQNLEQLKRKGVFDNPRMVEYVARRLRDSKEIAESRCFPYQLLVTYLQTGNTPQGFGWTTNFWDRAKSSEKGKEGDMYSIPKVIRESLEVALEEAIQNVPSISGKVFVCPDTSGSMGYPITGDRGYASPKTKVRCVDVAGLIAAAILRKNPMASCMPFSTKVHDIELSPMTSVMRNAAKFAELGGGGTACSAPLRLLNQLEAKGDVVIFVSDYESWSETKSHGIPPMMKEWNRFKVRNPKAKLICIDLTPRDNTQVNKNPDILQIGGFSDHVFKLIKDFTSGRLTPQHWTNVINETKL